MEAQKTDRRVKYTKMVVRESFISLLKEKPLSKITVKEICEGADINRATFYAHYTDPYDLLHQIEAALLEDVHKYLAEYSFSGEYIEDAVEIMEKIFGYIKENADTCAVLLSAHGDISFQQQVTMIVGGQFVSALTANKSVKKEDAEYIYYFLAHGSVGVIQKWLDDGMKKPASEMAKIIIQMAGRGFLSV